MSTGERWLLIRSKKHSFLCLRDCTSLCGFLTPICYTNIDLTMPASNFPDHDQCRGSSWTLSGCPSISFSGLLESRLPQAQFFFQRCSSVMWTIQSVHEMSPVKNCMHASHASLDKTSTLILPFYVQQFPDNPDGNSSFLKNFFNVGCSAQVSQAYKRVGRIIAA